MQADFTICPARPVDHPAFARFYAGLGHDDPTPDVERWTAYMMPHTFFLEQAGRKVGYAFVEVYGSLGYVRHVVVDADARGRGVGRVLMEAIARRLTARGCTRWELNVKSDNAPGRRLYESVGMSAQYATSVVRIDWTDALRLPAAGLAVARAIEPDGIEAEEEAAIERALGFPDGKVARLREQPDQVFVQLVGSDGSCLGFARFDPAFPGAYPFRVKAAELAGVLLRALHAHRSLDRDWLQLVIEDDAGTSRLLLASGARPVFEIVHYAGRVPGS